MIVLDPGIDLHTLALAPNAPAELTSSEAFEVFLADHPGFIFGLADATSAQLGYLTAAVGDGTYSLKDRLVWGYTFETPGAFAHPVPSDYPRSHTWWVFLDANTGEELQTEWQLGA